MKRDAVLLDWVASNTPGNVTWSDIGAGDGSVSRAIHALRPQAVFQCWDTAPRHPSVHTLSPWAFPDYVVDFTLFNFVLHHVRARRAVDEYIVRAFRQSRHVVIQEDLIDGTPETRAKLFRHDSCGRFFSVDAWVKILRRLCDGAPVEVFPHPELASDTLGYDVPRAMFVVHCGQSATAGGPQVPHPLATRISSSVGSTGSQAL